MVKKKVRIKVGYLETFTGQKYVFRLDDKGWVTTMSQMLSRVIDDKEGLGNVAVIALRTISEEEYQKIPKSQEMENVTHKRMD